ncbi:MAG: hypothetical protein JWO56_1994 [Acidobacteria bacterium]|nr:hypothetical protein [Acidobacteriota bacterium]
MPENVVAISSRNRLWNPVYKIVVVGDRTVTQIADWRDGTGPKPVAGMYMGENGFVSSIDDAAKSPIDGRIQTTSFCTGKNGETLIAIEYVLQIGSDGDVYRVVRKVDDDGRGFLTIYDPKGVAILVKSASVTDEAIPHIIVAYRTGLALGIARGTALGRNEVRAALHALISGGPESVP